jgi:hypothetical protein
MSLSDLASLGSFVSGLAVAVTLVFLLLQMRQAERNQRASMQLGLASRANDLLGPHGSPHFAQTMVKARTHPIDLSEVELMTASAWFSSVLLSWHSSFLHYRAGLLGTASMEAEDTNIRGALSVPLFRAMWQLTRSGYSKDFCDYVDKIIQEVPVFQSLELAPILKPLLEEILTKAVPQPTGEGALARMQDAFAP